MTTIRSRLVPTLDELLDSAHALRSLLEAIRLLTRLLTMIQEFSLLSVKSAS